MKKVLIASVGGSPEPIVNAITKVAPDFIYFFCSAGKAGSAALIAKIILPSTQLREEDYAVELVQSPDDLREVVAACARIDGDLATRFAGEEVTVVANYTGGTKTMSAGLVALALRRGWVAEVTERPARIWSGLITSVTLDAVTVFRNIVLDFSPGINVIIGENGTGKTHLLKCMYALLRATEEADSEVRVRRRGDKLERVLAGGMRSLFATVDDSSSVSVECERARLERTEALGAPASWAVTSAGPVRVRALFLPSREVMTMFTGFASAYETRELSFDETYYDLCKELSQRLFHEPPQELVGVLMELERIIGGPVRLDLDSFAIDTPKGPILGPMVAEGHRKLAMLAYLIKNGALTTESALFWDEPEANLNPKLIRVVARMIRQIARAGVQIFVSTHDYLLARELSMEAEYRPGDVDTLFFALHRASADEPVDVETCTKWGDLQCNPIFEAYAAHYEHEQDLFALGPQEDYA